MPGLEKNSSTWSAGSPGGLIPRTAVMVYAPRDQTELEVVERLIRESYDFARGSDPTR